MDDKVKDLFKSIFEPDPAMIEDANEAISTLSKKWEEEGKSGKTMAALLVAVIRKYVCLGHPSESLPVLVSMAWGTVIKMKQEDKG